MALIFDLGLAIVDRVRCVVGGGIELGVEVSSDEIQYAVLGCVDPSTRRAAAALFRYYSHARRALKSALGVRHWAGSVDCLAG